MTSRERVLVTLNHQEPDRIPIDLGGFQTGIHREAYRELIAHLGYDEKILILDPVQQIVRPSERVLERFRVDTRYISAHAPESFKGGIVQNWRAGRLWHDLRDEFGVVWSMPDDEPNYMDISRHPLAGATKADLADYPFPNGADPTRFSGVREEALRLRRETPFALATGISGVVYEVCWYMRGLEQWFEDLIERPEFCEALLDRVLAYWLDFETGFMKAVGDIADVVMIGDDLAGQDGPLFSPDLYRRLVKPRQKKLVRHLRSLTRAKIWYHTCGDASVLIPELIDNGIDILNPVQVGLKGMAPQSLKARFGKDLAFWGGGIDAQHVLPFASPAEVRNAVRKNMGAFKPGGGYVFNNVHNIQKGVPPANIVALFDAAYEFGRYGA
jgi:uroporphyrinogen decarboxylase